MDPGEELTGFGALDDPVVVGAGQGDDLADGHVGQRVRAGALELGGVFERADADDRGLSGHQPRHGVVRADPTGVGQRDGRPGIVFGDQFAGAGLADDLFVGGPELGEAHGVGALDGHDDQVAGAGLAGQVDGQSQVHLLRADHVGFAVDQAEGSVERRVISDRADQGVADQVGEGDFPAAVAGQEVVDHDPVVSYELGRDGPDRRRGGHVEGRGHVLCDRGSGAAQRVCRCAGLVPVAGFRDRSAMRGCRQGGRRGRPVRLRWRRCLLGCGVVGHRVAGSALGEEVSPDRVDLGGVDQEFLVLLLDEPVVRAELGFQLSPDSAGLIRVALGQRVDRRSHVASRPLTGRN